MNSVKVINIKTHNLKAITLYLQLILMAALVIFGVITLFFNKDMIAVVYFLFSGILGLMAWNNHKFYKKKYMSNLYLAFTLLTFISGILELL